MRHLLLGTFFACALASQIAAQTTYYPTSAWRTSTPEQQGVDSAKLAAGLEFVRQKSLNIHSLMVIRNGHVVLNADFYPYDSNSLHDMASVTKSFMSTLVGIAIGKGLIKGVQQPVIELLPKTTAAVPEPSKKVIRVEHLLTMTSGLDCGFRSGEPELFEMLKSPDWVQFTLSLPGVEAPGARFGYCSPGVHVLAAIIKERSGVPPLDFAREHLFKPLGIGDAVWPADRQGVNNGWGDLHLKPKDMAKLGYLFLNNGEWEGRAVVPREWVAAATKKHVPLPKDKSGLDRGYGYLWWIFPDLYAARGRGGQTIAVWPEKRMIVVATGGGFEPGDLLLSYIAPAVVSDQPLAANAEAAKRLRSAVETAKQPPKPEAVPALPPLAARISGQTYKLSPNWLGWRSFVLSFESGQARLDTNFGGESLNLKVGLDNVYRFAPGRFGIPAACKGNWQSDKVFAVDFNEIGNINHWRMTLTFEDNRVTVVVEEGTGLPGAKIEGSS